MATTMNVSLPDLMKEWVEDQIKTGHFSNASDHVRDLIRHDQEYQDRREMLIRALIVGENSIEGILTRSMLDFGLERTATYFQSLSQYLELHRFNMTTPE